MGRYNAEDWAGLADGTVAHDDSGEQVLHVSTRAATLLTKVLVTDSTYAPVRDLLRQNLTNHGRAVLDRLVTTLACQVLDVREPGHTCDGCDAAPICYCNAKQNIPHSMGTNGCAYA